MHVSELDPSVEAKIKSVKDEEDEALIHQLHPIAQDLSAEAEIRKVQKENENENTITLINGKPRTVDDSEEDCGLMSKFLGLNLAEVITRFLNGSSEEAEETNALNVEHNTKDGDTEHNVNYGHVNNVKMLHVDNFVTAHCEENTRHYSVNSFKVSLFSPLFECLFIPARHSLCSERLNFLLSFTES